jgi:hypothetical protein
MTKKYLHHQECYQEWRELYFLALERGDESGCRRAIFEMARHDVTAALMSWETGPDNMRSERLAHYRIKYGLGA